jgi:hypothetical protein
MPAIIPVPITKVNKYIRQNIFLETLAKIEAIIADVNSSRFAEIRQCL